MKQKTKNYVYSDFNLSIEPNYTADSKLVVNYAYNIALEDKIIKPNHDFSNIFKEIYNDDEFGNFYENNSELIDKFIYFANFEFFTDRVFNRLFFITDTLCLYELNKDLKTFTSLDTIFTKIPNVIKYENTLYFIDGKNITYFSEAGSKQTHSARNALNKFCKFNRRFYFILESEKFTIFSGNTSDFKNMFEEIIKFDSIELDSDDGAVLDVLVFKGNLYVIQQYKISKITVTDSEYKFTSNINMTFGILHNSIACIDDYIVFASLDGIYKFDGNNLVNCFKNITKNVNFSKLKAFSYNNKYYLNTEYYCKNDHLNMLIELNFATNTANLYKFNQIIDVYVNRGISFNDLYVVNYKNKKYEITRLDRTTSSHYKKYLKFNPIYFDETNYKTINYIKICSTGSFKFIISSESDTRELNITGNFEINTLGLIGQVFNIEILSDDFFEISMLKLGVSECEY